MTKSNAYSLIIEPDIEGEDWAVVQIRLNDEVIVSTSLYPNEEVEHLKRLIQLANVALLDG